MTIKIGVIGAGKNTRDKHIPGLQAIEGVEVVGVCNRSRESSAQVAEQFGIPVVYDDWWQVVQDENVDAIVIGTWPYMHARMTVAALEADKHVMCEARMAMNLDEALQMRDAARRKPHLTAQIVPSPMTLRVDNTIKRLIAEGYLGDILAIELRAGGDFLDADSAMHWRQNKDYSGLNVMSMGIWYEALLRWVGEAKSVMAMGKTFVTMRPDAESGVMKAVHVPDHINIIADMACGAQAHLMISSVAGMAGGTGVYLFGSNGTLHFADGKLYGGQRGHSELREIEPKAGEAGGWRVEEEFINAIRGEEAIIHTDFDTGVKYMAFTEAVARSMAEGRKIPV